MLRRQSEFVLLSIKGRYSAPKRDVKRRRLVNGHFPFFIGA